MAEDNHAKYYMSQTTYKLSDGTEKTITGRHKHIVKGYVHDDGTVCMFTKEQLEEMKRRYDLGVPKKKLAQQFNCSVPTVSKYMK